LKSEDSTSDKRRTWKPREESRIFFSKKEKEYYEEKKRKQRKANRYNEGKKDKEITECEKGIKKEGRKKVMMNECSTYWSDCTWSTVWWAGDHSEPKPSGLKPQHRN